VVAAIMTCAVAAVIALITLLAFQRGAESPSTGA
jgi:hypothetical protein